MKLGLGGGAVPTLNAFDNGDTRATVLILTEPILMRDREGKAGGGKGLLMSNTAFTLSASNFHTLFIPGKEEVMEKEPIIFYGNRVNDIRMQGDVINTLQARMGTGGNNMPMVSYPIQDGRDMEKNQNGLGIGDETNPSYTLDRTGGQAVAYSIREDAKANSFSATETDTALTVQAHQPSVQSHHAQLFIVEEESKVFEPKSAFEENWAESQVKNALRAGASKSSHAVTNQATVRRLTPVECERLQGFPDNWTDDQADTNRYKQMGNAVAVPVVDYIIKRLITLNTESSSDTAVQ